MKSIHWGPRTLGIVRSDWELIGKPDLSVSSQENQSVRCHADEPGKSGKCYCSARVIEDGLAFSFVL